jgi:hypothetical protein
MHFCPYMILLIPLLRYLTHYELKGHYSILPDINIVFKPIILLQYSRLLNDSFVFVYTSAMDVWIKTIEHIEKHVICLFQYSTIKCFS